MSTTPDPELTIADEDGDAIWASDVIAEQLRALGVPFISLTPGSSYRGLHDSLVNHLGDSDPQMVMCLHEEHAVAVAHGYAKATGRPLLVALHANVGLMHAVMAIYNAWADRVPMLIIGANGPWDAAQRRPWIDWLHTTGDPGALIRQFVRWDDQPASLEASLHSLMRAWQLTTTAPYAPTYVSLDVAMQERPLGDPVALLDPSRHAAPEPAVPSPASVTEIAEALAAAASPLLLVGRVSRDPEAWADRVALAHALSARVGTDLKIGSTFPTADPLHVGTPGYLPGAELRAAVDGAGRQIETQIAKSAALKDDLAFLTERGERLADRLDGQVRATQPLTPERKMLPERKASQPEAAVEAGRPAGFSQAELDLQHQARSAATRRAQNSPLAISINACTSST